MDEALVEAVLSRVREKLREDLPPALLIGKAPETDLGYRYVTGAPYTAVVIGSLEPGQLLQFREERVLTALLEGIPVLLYTPGLPGKNSKNRSLQTSLGSALRQLQSWGVRLTDGRPGHRLISAQEARRLKEQGLEPPPGGILTPSARDILNL